MSINPTGAGAAAPAAAAPAGNSFPQLSTKASLGILTTLGQANIAGILSTFGPNTLPNGAQEFALLSPQALTALQVPFGKSDQITALEAAKTKLKRAKERKASAYARIEELREIDSDFVAQSLKIYKDLHNIENNLLLARSHAASLTSEGDKEASNDAINILETKKRALTKKIRAAKKVNNSLDTKVFVSANAINCSEDIIRESTALIAELERKLEE